MLRYIGYILLLSILPTVFCNLEFDICPGEPAPLAGRVAGCDVLPCYLSNGDVLQFEIDFIAPFFTNELIIAVNVTSFGIISEFPIEPPFNNGCNFLNGNSCPLPSGQAATLAVDFPMETEAQGGIPMTVSMRVYGDDNQTVFCIIGGIIII